MKMLNNCDHMDIPRDQAREFRVSYFTEIVLGPTQKRLFTKLCAKTMPSVHAQIVVSQSTAEIFPWPQK